MDKYVVGIDIGGQSTKLGIVDARGNILCQSVISSLQTRLDDFLDDLTRALQELIHQAGGKEKIRGIGVGAPNGNYYKSSIEFAPNLKWGYDAQGNPMIIQLGKLLSDRIGVPVAVTNDANAAAVGEMTYGAARGMKYFIMITLGTGVGSGIVINGQVLYGHDGFAGELGHTLAVRGGRPCNCGRAGCLETYTSAIGVARTAREFLANQTTPSLLRELDPDTISSKDIFEAAEKGDQLIEEGLCVAHTAFGGAGNGVAVYQFGIAEGARLLAEQLFHAPTVAGDLSAEFVFRKDEGKAFSKILKEMQNAGYRIYPNLYKFEEYGVPQARHRMIIVGIREDLPFEYKVPSTEKYKGIDVSCKTAIEIPPIPRDAANNELTKQSATVVERLKHIKPGQNAFTANLPEELQLNVKGAKISHKSAVNRILWMHDKYPLGSDGVILQKTPYTFDVSVWEHFWWGICGGSLAASKPGEHFLPAKILDEVYKSEIVFSYRLNSDIHCTLSQQTHII